MNLQIENLLNCEDGKSQLAILPISRLLLESPFQVGGYIFFPAGALNLDSFRIESPLDLSDLWGKEIEDALWLEGDNLRKAATSVTGATVEIFQSNASVAFLVDRDTFCFERINHGDDLRLLSLLSQQAERAMDWIRFDFCRFDLPDTLPGTAGTWMGSDAFCCAILIDPTSQVGELVAGEAILHSTVSKGLGLELDSAQCSMANEEQLPSAVDGEVGSIASHSLRLFSDVMNANTDTSKYLRAMTLLEFLASPFTYQRFQDTKKDIIAHLASNLSQYHQLIEHFRRFSDKKDDSTGEQMGYRTLIVHHGRFLEDILPSQSDRVNLFRELQHYTAKVIDDLVQQKSAQWTEIETYRLIRREAIMANR